MTASAGPLTIRRAGGAASLLRWPPRCGVYIQRCMAVWRLILATLLAAFGGGISFAQDGAHAQDYVRTEHAESWLVPERDGFAPGETTWFALSQKIQDGWHVYWRNPGDSGLPLVFDWSLPEGFSGGDVVYPTPERIPAGPFVNFGHHGAPVFLVPVTAPADAAPGDTVNVVVKATWLICEDICVPEEADFSLALPVAATPAPNEKGEALVAKARAATPVEMLGESFFHAQKDAIVLDAPAPESRFTEAYFFPGADGLTEPAAAQKMKVKDGRLTLSMTPGYAYKADTLEKLDGVLAIEFADGARQGYALTAFPGEGAAMALGANPSTGGAGAKPATGLPLLLLMSFLGGVILNVMPCVFPIVFIKAAALVKGAHGEQGVARRHGLLYAAGVVATFVLLGGLLLMLRAGGEQLGWGFHLQSPIVVLLSAYVLFMVGLNLAGVFHVGTSLQNVGDGLTSKDGNLGAFFTGALAVFVAAPCIGPLLSAPMGAAVMLPPLAGMSIFIALALGLAAPYLSISFVPALGRLLPKPGPWMTVFKQALAFPVFAAAAFFLWVLAQQTGAEGLGRALAGLIFLAFAGWLFELGKGARGLWLKAGAAAAVIAAFAPMLSLKLVETAEASEGGYGALATVAYDAAKLSELRAAGEPVFVDFTAAWCVVCQFNKATVLSRGSLAEAFAEKGVAVMVADWTRRDPEITEALAEFGANGVPLYVYYPPAGEPVVLPLPLSENAILKAVGAKS